jgi:hypothetical protein
LLFLVVYLLSGMEKVVPRVVVFPKLSMLK